MEAGDEEVIGGAAFDAEEIIEESDRADEFRNSDDANLVIWWLGYVCSHSALMTWNRRILPLGHF